MPYLVVSGITVWVTNGRGARSAPVQIGSSTRAFAGNLRSTWRAKKREWQFQTELMELSAETTLLAAIALGAHVTCSGDALGGSITCEVTDTGASDEVAGPNGLMRSLSLLLREV